MFAICAADGGTPNGAYKGKKVQSSNAVRHMITLIQYTSRVLTSQHTNSWHGLRFSQSRKNIKKVLTSNTSSATSARVSMKIRCSSENCRTYNRHRLYHHNQHPIFTLNSSNRQKKRTTLVFQTKKKKTRQRWTSAKNIRTTPNLLPSLWSTVRSWTRLTSKTKSGSNRPVCFTQPYPVQT